MANDLLPNLRRRAFRQHIGTRAVVWIDPVKVTLHFGSKWPVTKARMTKLGAIVPRPLLAPLQAPLRKREPFFIPDWAFAPPHDIEKTPRYRLVSDFVAKRQTPRDTAWFSMLRDELAKKGQARHKDIILKSEDEILEFLEGYVGGLADSLSTEGFKPIGKAFEPSAVITKDGRLAKSGSGNHRFNMARVLKIDRFPLRIIGAHEDWYRRNAKGPYSEEALLEMFEEVGAAHR